LCVEIILNISRQNVEWKDSRKLVFSILNGPYNRLTIAALCDHVCCGTGNGWGRFWALPRHVTGGSGAARRKNCLSCFLSPLEAYLPITMTLSAIITGEYLPGLTKTPIETQTGVNGIRHLTFAGCNLLPQLHLRPDDT